MLLLPPIFYDVQIYLLCELQLNLNSKNNVVSRGDRMMLYFLLFPYFVHLNLTIVNVI